MPAAWPVSWKAKLKPRHCGLLLHLSPQLATLGDGSGPASDFPDGKS